MLKYSYWIEFAYWICLFEREKKTKLSRQHIKSWARSYTTKSFNKSCCKSFLVCSYDFIFELWNWYESFIYIKCVMTVFRISVRMQSSRPQHHTWMRCFVISNANQSNKFHFEQTHRMLMQSLEYLPYNDANRLIIISLNKFIYSCLSISLTHFSKKKFN